MLLNGGERPAAAARMSGGVPKRAQWADDTDSDVDEVRVLLEYVYDVRSGVCHVCVRSRAFGVSYFVYYLVFAVRGMGFPMCLVVYHMLTFCAGG